MKQLDHGPSIKLTFEGNTNIYPVWTPDGQNITYDSDVSGFEALWTKRADGSAQAVLQLRDKREPSEAVWSRDGKWLVARTSVTSEGNGDIIAIRPGIDSVPITLIATQFSELSPTLSPDGKWMAYTSTETGDNEVYVVPFPNASAAKWPVSAGGGREPLWSHSGREIFYRSGANMMSVEVQTAPVFSVGRTTTLFPTVGFVTNANHRQYDITPNDKRFVFVRALGGRAAVRLVFVENWFEELKRRK